METSSFVSKAKTAFHSAAAKAEKVLIDIKADLKTDREFEGQSQKISSKLSETESIPVKKQEEHSREKPAHLSKKKDWQVRMKNMRKGKTGKEEKEISEDSNSAVLALDENLGQMDLGIVSEVKDSERISTAEEEGSISTNTLKIPPASVLKQLAIAVEAGKKFKSMKDLLTPARGSSPLRERAGLSFSAVKSLVLREKEEKLTSEYGDDEVLSLIHSLFDAEGHLPRWKNGSGSASLTMITLPRDIHAAPPESFVVKLSEVTGSFKTLRKMALFWCRVVAELRRLWSEGQPVPGVPLDEIPDLNSCLLHQQLQVINCCISRKRRRTLATESLESVMGEASPNIGESAVSLGISSPLLYARISSGDLVLRLGADHPSELTMLETGELVYSPVTQEGPLLTEDLIRETEEFVLRTGSVGAGCSQLLSDMQAFKAANPGCILEDFVRWHSPPDWTETEPSNETEDSFDGDDTLSKRGQLSGRMQKEGNLWRELWETAKPLPAVKQTPLFDEDMAVESILNILEEIPPSELFEQMFVSLLGSGFVVAEATSSVNSNLLKLFYECKDFVVATCQGDTWSENVDDLCQVYETVETILIHPEDALKIMKQSEETTTAGEPKRRFKRLSLNFGGKDRHFLRKSASKDQKNSEENPKNTEESATRQVFSNLFDGKSSIFAKKPPKPSNAPQADTTPSPEENGWTIV